MATLTIKNIPDHVYENLKKQAALHHRSINSEVIVCLESMLQPRPNVQRILKEARRFRAKTAKHKITEKTLKSAKNEGRL